MQKYRHIVQYYETDKMGITHHSNYIRWMEEARIDFLRQIGWDYAKLESLGIISPVIAVDCKYKKSTRCICIFKINSYLCIRKTENASLAQLARARDL